MGRSEMKQGTTANTKLAFALLGYHNLSPPNSLSLLFFVKYKNMTRPGSEHKVLQLFKCSK
jgi:hypothetical protein